jgi:hypothetical protein
MAARHVNNNPPQFAQVLAYFLDVLAHLGADFDLRTE